MYDWDQIGKDTLLGRCEVAFDGEQLESFAAKDVEASLGGGATIRLRMLWSPQLLARKRTGTTLLSSTTKIFTSAPGAAFGVGKDVVGAGFGAGTKVIGTGGKVIGGGVSAIGGGVSAIGGGVSAIGSGIGSGIRGIGRFGKKDKASDASSDSSSTTPAPAPVPTTSTTSTNHDGRASVDSGAVPRQSMGEGMWFRIRVIE